MPKKKPVENFWDYRILKHTNKHGDWYAIHEVYYKNGKPWMCSTEPEQVLSEDLNDIEKILGTMLNDCKRSMDDILDYDSFEPKKKSRGRQNKR